MSTGALKKGLGLGLAFMRGLIGIFASGGGRAFALPFSFAFISTFELARPSASAPISFNDVPHFFTAFGESEGVMIHTDSFLYFPHL